MAVPLKLESSRSGIIMIFYLINIVLFYHITCRCTKDGNRAPTVLHSITTVLKMKSKLHTVILKFILLLFYNQDYEF